MLVNLDIAVQMTLLCQLADFMTLSTCATGIGLGFCFVFTRVLSANHHSSCHLTK